jgi:hypothetical protein
MKNTKNLLIALLTGLLALSLFSQPAQSAPKPTPAPATTAIKLAQYTACLAKAGTTSGSATDIENSMKFIITLCAPYAR